MTALVDQSYLIGVQVLDDRNHYANARQIALATVPQAGDRIVFRDGSGWEQHPPLFVRAVHHVAQGFGYRPHVLIDAWVNP